MNSKAKARIVTVCLFVFIVLLCANIVALWPRALPWVLGVFAIPGAWKFCRVTYKWLTVEEQPKLPTYQDFAEARK